MKRRGSQEWNGILGGALGLAILLGFPAERSHSATPTVKLPGAYPYETPVQVPAPPAVSDSSPLPSPAPFPYQASAPSISAPQEHDSRGTVARRPVTAKDVRKAAFKYNGVPNFWGFLAALPADVSVFDPKLGRQRALVKGGHVLPKNVSWLRKHKQASGHE